MQLFLMPVGLLQFAFFCGLTLVFFAFLVRAVVGRPAESGGRREGRSRIGIMLQALGIFCAGLGPARIALPLLAPAALLGAIAVLMLMGGAIYLFAASSRALGANWSFEARTRTDHQLIRS